MAGGEREPDSARVGESDTRRGALYKRLTLGRLLSYGAEPVGPGRCIRRSCKEEPPFMNPFAALGLGLVLGLRDAADAACMSHSGQIPTLMCNTIPSQ